nr:hypothetical protein OG409_38275 [Streptomyces sp. NBC_00974]
MSQLADQRAESTALKAGEDRMGQGRAAKALRQKPYLNRSWNVRVEQGSRQGDLPVVRA